MNKYFSDFLKTLLPYRPGEQPKDKSYIKLNTNESPYPPSEKVLSAIREAVNGDLRLYPDLKASRLKESISRFYSVNTENVFVSNGSDEALAYAFQAFFKKSQPLQMPDITYSFYPSYCKLFSIDYRTFPLTDTFEIDIEQVPDNGGGVIIANPNAPTGICMGLDRIEGILKKNTESLVLIDEAYIDFGGETAVPLIDKYPNLLVVQTVSKSRALAGLRVGLAIGNEELINALEDVKDSFNAYPLDTLAIAGASAAFDDREDFETNTQKVIATREHVANELTKLNFYVVPSSANFLMAQHKEIPAKDLYLRLKENGILIRYFDSPRIDNFVRISIGTDQDMNTLVDSLRKILNC
jgi:histidinol-phosphate aminotransferase